MLRAAVADADLEGALADWRRWRRDHRVAAADVHWIDVLYRAYLTGIVSLVAVLFASSAVGDTPLRPVAVADVLRDGPAWVGAVATLAIALGLRSGSRGGPLALERAEVRHVLLAPVDRTTALRDPALRQLRFLAFVGIVVGGIGGELASRRLPGETAAWVGTGALAGVTAVGLTMGTAYVTNGLRPPRWVASGLGSALVALAVLDGAAVTVTSPTAPFGRLALWPLEFDLLGLLPVGLALALVLVGLARLGVCSLEDAERRSTLVGQLRFAATLQDLRTVVLLRRQLALELPRRRPWIRLAVHGSGRLPVVVRGLRGVLRWPAARMARLVLLAAVAAGALRGVWVGTTPLVVVAGLAMFVAGLDGVEPLAQEVDHPSRRDAAPREPGDLHLRHVPVAVLVLFVTATLAAVGAALPGPGRVPAAIAVVLVLPLALGGTAGALVSLLGTAPSMNEALTLAAPEAQGMRLAFRMVWPPAIATLGAAPVLLAREAVADGRSGPVAAWSLGAAGVALFLFVCGWVRVRERVHAWWSTQLETVMPTRSDADRA
ncbi:MAG: hypothetical protein Q8K58_16920 [Acidimicrobiales bacterium]|nr:hypothetical protein [Acidimicrobiales bacterium]